MRCNRGRSAAVRRRRVNRLRLFVFSLVVQLCPGGYWGCEVGRHWDEQEAFRDRLETRVVLSCSSKRDMVVMSSPQLLAFIQLTCQGLSFSCYGIPRQEWTDRRALIGQCLA